MRTFGVLDIDDIASWVIGSVSANLSCMGTAAEMLPSVCTETKARRGTHRPCGKTLHIGQVFTA